MLGIPDFVPDILLPLWSRLVAWFSRQVYVRLVRPDDFLVRLADHLDLRPLEEACAAYQHTDGPGVHPTHTVAHLVRALLVKYLDDLSLRDLEQEIRTNLVAKWFVGYSIFDRGPDHSTLDRFEQWVIAHQHRTFFDTVLHQIDTDFPDERHHPQVGDTFAMQADAAKETLVRLLRHLCQSLLRTLAAADPAGYAQLSGQLDATALFGAPDERNEFWLNDAARQARLQTTAVAALRCADLVQAHLTAATYLEPTPRQTLTASLTDLTKVLADEMQFTRDAQSQVIQVTELPKQEKGTYRLGSATDPDATYRVHGSDKVDLGYNVNLAVSVDPQDSQRAGFIREIQAATGAQPDAVGIPALLTAQKEHHGFVPPKLMYDAAAGEAKTRAAVAAATNGQTLLVAPLRTGAQRHVFGPADFVLSADGTTLTCPNGQTTQTAYRSQSADGRLFRFTGAQCQGCPFWQDCRGAPPAAAPAMPAPVAELPAAAPATSAPVAELPAAAPATPAPVAELPAAAPATSAPVAELPAAAPATSAPVAELPAATPATPVPVAELPAAAPATPAPAPAVPPKSKGTMRQVFINDHRNALDQARTYNATEQYQLDMHLRPAVERTIAALVRYNGARRCHGRGLEKADFQARMAATAYNLKRWLALTARCPTLCAAPA
jgi:IS5 family transposase